MIVTDVDGSQIPIFVIEEIDDIDEVEESDNEH